MRSANMAFSRAVERHGRWLILLAWLACSAVMLWLFHGDFAALGFRDPDDAMRLVQVRDWIGGQNFWDVSQHRVNPPLGGPMHWSRIVDMPVAGLILLARLLLGPATAELVACITVPLLLLGGLAGTVHLAARRLGDPVLALMTVALLLTAPSILVQFTPLRIDHHGWQIWMATIALAGALDSSRVRGGVTSALALAVWLQISSEALPYVALFAGLFALRQWLDGREAPRFMAFAATLGGAALALLALLRGKAALLHDQCDALSAAYVWPLVAMAVLVPLAGKLIGTASMSRRFLIAAIGGGAAIAILLAIGGPCLSGDPFQALGPLAYKYWYLQVMEGRPIWVQSLSLRGVILLPALVGLAGAMVAARQTVNRDARMRWLALGLLLLGAMAVSLLVMRAVSVAHVYALPGVAWLLIALFRKVQASSQALVRVLGSVALILLTPAGISALWIALIPNAPSAKTSAVNCRAAATLAPLHTLPPSTLFAPLDLGPDILVQTPHRVIGTAHHRNAAGITAVIEGFMATPEKARAVIQSVNGGRGADYVVTCAGLTEYALYAKDHPQSLSAHLMRSNVPDWLQPLPTKGPLRIYKVRRD
jgi:hypothetical protein